MPWVCEFCGWENHQDDRVGLEEPACIRCGHRRFSQVVEINDLIETIDRCKQWEWEYGERVECKTSIIEDLRATLGNEIYEHNKLLAERLENQKELAAAQKRLHNLETRGRPGRHITPDQLTLQGEIT